MKFLTIFIFIFSFCISANAQVYKPINFKNNTYTFYNFYGNFTLNNHAIHISWVKDTLINNKAHVKMKNIKALNGVYQGFSGYSYFYEDSIAQKVYVYDWANSIDTLLYDFNIQVGDTAKSAYWHSGKYVVDSITNEYINNNVLRVYYFRNVMWPFREDKITESIGGYSGLNRNFTNWEDGGYLHCFSKDSDLKIYDQEVQIDSLPHPGICATPIEPIYFLNNSLVLPISNPISISQSNNQIIIQSKISELIQISIYNLQGKLVWQQSSGNAPIIIGESQFSKGIYIVNVKNKSTNYNAKIAVQ